MSPRRTIVKPSLRARFVRRAGYLKEDRDFQHALQEERRIWDERFPDYAVGKPSWPPDDVIDETRSFMMVYPSQLERNRQSLPVRKLHEADKTGALAVATISREWERLVRRMAGAWWPEPYFPRWRAIDGSHPANPFIAACLIWRLLGVSEELIARDTALNVSLIAPDADVAQPGELAFGNTYARVVDSALEAAIASGTAMTVEEMIGLRDRALVESRIASATVRSSNKTEWPLAVFLVEGMTTSDWRDLEQMVMRILAHRYGTNPVYRHVRHLHSTGWSNARIAKLLGLEQNLIPYILEQPDTD